MKRLVLAVIACLSIVSACGGGEAAPAAAGAAATGGASGDRFAITVDGSGYHPGTVRVHAGQPTTLVITRTSDEGCGQQIFFPSINLRRDLPLNEAVEVHLTPQAGEIAFTCGMNMLRGTIIAE